MHRDVQQLAEDNHPRVVVQRPAGVLRAGREAEDANLRDEHGQKARQHTPGRDQYKHDTTQHNTTGYKLWLNSSLAYQEIVALVYVHIGDPRERRCRQEVGVTEPSNLMSSEEYSSSIRY
jgi:general stress protein YciG